MGGLRENCEEQVVQTVQTDRGVGKNDRICCGESDGKEDREPKPDREGFHAVLTKLGLQPADGE